MEAYVNDRGHIATLISVSNFLGPALHCAPLRHNGKASRTYSWVLEDWVLVQLTAVVTCEMPGHGGSS